MSEHMIRRADMHEAPAIAELWLGSRRAAEIPPAAHSDEDVRTWVSGVLLPSSEVWVATADGEVAGMMALGDDWLDQLYIAPGHQRQGHGHRLLAHAQSARSSLSLWTFASNLVAQRFYEAHGFVPAGSPSMDNEEHALALCYRWRRSDV